MPSPMQPIATTDLERSSRAAFCSGPFRRCHPHLVPATTSPPSGSWSAIGREKPQLAASPTPCCSRVTSGDEIGAVEPSRDHHADDRHVDAGTFRTRRGSLESSDQADADSFLNRLVVRPALQPAPLTPPPHSIDPVILHPPSPRRIGSLPTARSTIGHSYRMSQPSNAQTGSRWCVASRPQPSTIRHHRLIDGSWSDSTERTTTSGLRGLDVAPVESYRFGDQ